MSTTPSYYSILREGELMKFERERVLELIVKIIRL